MSDTDCTAFLQWALPQANLRWAGFRKVRRQVCKRLKRRMDDLRLADFASYRVRLETDPAEWVVFDECCHITISRFFRDRASSKSCAGEYCQTSLLAPDEKGGMLASGPPVAPPAKSPTPSGSSGTWR